MHRGVRLEVALLLGEWQRRAERDGEEQRGNECGGAERLQHGKEPVARHAESKHKRLGKRSEASWMSGMFPAAVTRFFCHSGRSEDSTRGSHLRPWILRCAQNDR